MPLDYQNVPMPLQGVDTKTDERNVISGKFILGENCFMQKSGKIQSRYGYSLGYQGSVDHRVGGLMNGVPTAIRPGYIDKLTFPANRVAMNIPLLPAENGIDLTLSTLYPDIGMFASTNASTRVLAVTFSGSLYRVSIIDVASMVEIDYRTGSPATIAEAHVAAEGFNAAAIVGTGNNMMLYVAGTMVTVSAYAVTPVAGIVSNVSDIAYNSVGNIGLVWSDGGNVYFAYWNGSTWSGTTTVAAFAATVVGIAKADTAGQWNIVAAAGTTIKTYRISAVGSVVSSTSQVTADYTNPAAAVAIPSTTNCFAVQGYTLTAGTYRSFGTVIQNNTLTYFEPCTKIAAKSHSKLLTLVNGSIKNYGDASASVENLSGIATYSVFYIGDKTEYCFSYDSGVSRISYTSDFKDLPLNQPSFEVGGYFFGAKITDYINSLSTKTYTIINSAFRVTAAYLATWVEYNGSAYTNVFGSLRQISSTSILPQEIPVSFPFAPSMPKLTAVAGTMTVGQYQVVLVYESIDARGRPIRSPVSSPETITLSAPNAAITVAINTPYYSFSSELPGKVVVYVTKNDETIFYRAGSLVGTGTGNISISTTPTGAEQALYTTGGALDAGNPGLSAGIFTARDRLWSISAENRNVVYFSQITTPSECPKFNEALYLNVPDLGGRLIAVAEMDEKILLFKEYAIYITYGAGPDNLGNGEYPAPQLISQSLGCSYARSVVLTDSGVMFMSAEGIWLMSRGLQLEYIGAPVEAYNSLTITGALNLVDRHQVWFFSNSGTTLVWDEFHKVWYAFTGQNSYVSLLQTDGKPAYVNNVSGKYLIENKAAVNDDGTTFKLKLKTGWTSLAGIQGFQRFRKLQWSGSASDNLTLKLYYDFDSTLAETFTVVPATVGTPYQFEIKPARQKCEAIQFEIESAALTAQMSLQTFSIEAGAKKGTNRVAPTTKRVQGV